jgi:putative acetyltransferase
VSGDVNVELTQESTSDIEVGSVIRAHLDFCYGATPAEGVFAMSAEALESGDVTLLGIRVDGSLRGICALKRLNDDHAELKSMHVLTSARGLGLARQLLDHAMATARAQGYRRISLETGNIDAFEPARALYRQAGFVVIPAFGDYVDVSTSVCMTRILD